MNQSHPYSTIKTLSGGGVILTPCPGLKETTIEQALNTLKEQGATRLFTLMGDSELEKFEVSALGDECLKAEMIWHQLPIKDKSIPTTDWLNTWEEIKGDLLSFLQSGGSIAVHCKGGSGRTGLIAAFLLIQLGWKFEDAKEAVQALKPKALQSEEQLEFLARFCNLATA